MTPTDWLSGPAPEVAPTLLGARITAQATEGEVSVVITEVEAYAGRDDPASHAWRGRTPRNAVMFGPAGWLYVYRSYGLHWCANVVCGPDGAAAAVLLRAGRVVVGHDLARIRRGSVPASALARGPACLTRALGINARHDGSPLLESGALQLVRGEALPCAAGPRVGISRAADVAWRFWVPGDDTVSTYRRSGRVGDGQTGSR